MSGSSWKPSRVFVYYPPGAGSGGPEALRQLCDAVRSAGIPCWLVPLAWHSAGQDVSEFDRYGCAAATVVPDEPDVAVVVPDVALSYAARFQKARVIAWWLSIDFSELYGPRMARERRQVSWGGTAVRAFRIVAPWHPELRTSQLRALLPQVSHCAQSEYARRFLMTHENLEPSLLSDYVQLEQRFQHRDDGGQGAIRRPRSVAYNPAKGERYLKALRSRSTDIEWRPISGLDRVQVGELLESTEAYIDLGHHPGKDRIPREAALAGCVVLVGDRGAGALAEDVPVEDALRIPMSDDVGTTASRAHEVLRDVLASPEHWRAGQASYREWIRAEESRFREEVRRIFVEGDLAPPRRA